MTRVRRAINKFRVWCPVCDQFGIEVKTYTAEEIKHYKIDRCACGSKLRQVQVYEEHERVK